MTYSQVRCSSYDLLNCYRKSYPQPPPHCPHLIPQVPMRSLPSLFCLCSQLAVSVQSTTWTDSSPNNLLCVACDVNPTTQFHSLTTNPLTLSSSPLIQPDGLEKRCELLPFLLHFESKSVYSRYTNSLLCTTKFTTAIKIASHEQSSIC